jgi:HK97 family phage major capsid protein
MTQTTEKARAEMSATELRDRAKEMRAEFAELTETRATDDGKKAIAEFRAEMESIDTHLTLWGMAEGDANAYRMARAAGVPGGAVPPEQRKEKLTLGERYVESEEYREWSKRQQNGSSPELEFRDVVAVGDANGSSGLLPVGQPYIANVRQRRLFVRDLIGVQTTGLANIPYIREKNPTVNQNSAATVAEQGTKPDSKLEFTQDNAPVEVIAGSVTITNQIRWDAPTLMGYINNALPYRIKLEEEDQVLNGDGTSPNLKGILTYTDVQSTTVPAGTGGGYGDLPLLIGGGIAKIELVDGFADGVVMNPADFWAMVTARAAGGAGTFDAGAFTQAPIQYVWGLPVVRTNGVTAGQAVVANWALGATLFDRMGITVRTFEQHSDYAIKNKVLLLGEERVALAVNRPDYFCKVPLRKAA